MNTMWEEYRTRPRKGRPGLRPYVSINPRGEIFINPPALALMEEAINVVIFYDPELNRFGLRGARQPDLGRLIFKARRCGRRKRAYVIRARRLFKHFGVHIDQTIIFTTFKIEPGPMLVLDLTTAKPVGL
jgi:hypothetical protein